MFRFNCTHCKQIKRVRIIPSIIHPHYDLIKDPKQRTGVCDYHSSSANDKSAKSSHREFNRIERGR